MFHPPFLVSVLLLSLPAAATPPCARTLDGAHVPAFTTAASAELALQTQCLAWESSVQPKAEFIPPAAAPAPPRLATARTLVVAPSRATTLDEILSARRSFHLGALLSPDGAPAAVPPPSDRRP